MKLRRNKTDRSAPGVLAHELAVAKETREARVAAAEAEFTDARQSVIERGTNRVREINALQSELEAEKRDLVEVVQQA